jgi:hypothetical protein
MVNAAGTVKDVVESQAHGLASQGFFKVADSVGSTAQRPNTGLFQGFRFYDTTLNKIVLWVGGGGGMQHPVNAEAGGFWTDGTGAAV